MLCSPALFSMAHLFPITISLVAPKKFAEFVGRLMKGESTAVVGEPRIGRTSLVNYLVNQKTRQELYEDNANQWHFSHIDAKMLGTQFAPAQFWEHAVAPLKRHIQKEPKDSPLMQHYKVCRKKQFGNFTLERLFAQLRKSGRRFILIVDELDCLMHHPVLNTAEFYGGLRALAYRREGAFALIITSLTPLSQLNAATQEFNPTAHHFLIFLQKSRWDIFQLMISKNFLI